MGCSFLLLVGTVVWLVYAMLWGPLGLWGEEGYFAKQEKERAWDLAEKEEKEKERAELYRIRCSDCPPDPPVFYKYLDNSHDIMNKQNRYEAEIRRCISDGCRM